MLQQTQCLKKFILFFLLIKWQSDNAVVFVLYYEFSFTVSINLFQKVFFPSVKIFNVFPFGVYEKLITQRFTVFFAQNENKIGLKCLTVKEVIDRKMPLVTDEKNVIVGFL